MCTLFLALSDTWPILKLQIFYCFRWNPFKSGLLVNAFENKLQRLYVHHTYTNICFNCLTSRPGSFEQGVADFTLGIDALIFGKSLHFCQFSWCCMIDQEDFLGQPVPVWMGHREQTLPTGSHDRNLGLCGRTKVSPHQLEEVWL